jgi:hypothetical protein
MGKKALLLFPPQCDPRGPYLGIPSLTAFLRKGGVEVVQRDLNVEAYDLLLTREGMEESLERIAWRREKGDSSPDAFRRWEEAEKIGPYLLENVEAAKAILKDGEAFFDIDRFNWARRVLSLGCEILSAPYHPTRWSLLDYQMDASPYRTEELLRAVENPEENLFLEFYRRILPSLLSVKPDLVGISIATYHQVLPGLTLSRLLKEAGLPTAVGGTLFTKLVDRFPEVPSLFRLADHFIVFEGEQALLHLLEALEGERKMEEVENLVYAEGGKVRINRPFHGEDLDALPTPDFDGLPWDRYLTPRPVLPLALSKGCYWRRCTFCEIHHSHSQAGRSYRSRKMEKVLEDVDTLSRRHGTPYFLFTDECVSPGRLRSLSKGILAAGLSVEWLAYARFEKALNRELAHLIARAGCRKLMLGLESANPRILDRMKKGVDLDHCRRVLRDLQEEGVAVHLFCMIGFPTETEAEAQKTLDFVLEQREVVESIGFSMDMGAFTLARHSEICQSPGDYGITRILPGEDLALTYEFDAQGGMSREEVLRKQVEYYEILHRTFALRYLPYWEEYSLLYLARLRGGRGRRLPAQKDVPQGS